MCLFAKRKSFVDIIETYNNENIDKIDLPHDNYNRNIVCELERLIEVTDGKIIVGKCSEVTLLSVHGLSENGNFLIHNYILEKCVKYVEPSETGYSKIGRSSYAHKRDVYFIKTEISNSIKLPRYFNTMSVVDCYLS